MILWCNFKKRGGQTLHEEHVLHRGHSGAIGKLRKKAGEEEMGDDDDDDDTNTH